MFISSGKAVFNVIWTANVSGRKTEKVNGEEKKTRYYDETKDDPNAWDSLDPVAKGACIDMEYNGALKKYPKFVKAIKNKDYKRAAYELLDSTDFKNKAKGVQNRRSDMAKDLMKLHEEKSKSPK